MVPPLTPGGVYSITVTIPSSTASPDIVVNVSAVGGTLSTSSTTAFRNTGISTWKLVGYITNDVAVSAPSITFSYASGCLVAGATASCGRFDADAVQFINQADPCLSGFPQLPTVNGPLAAGQTFVDVPAVAVGATGLTVYANGVQIGQKTSGIVAGVNRVTTSPLVKDRIVTATQNNSSGVESCRSSTGPNIGSGANPRIRISLSIRQGTSATSFSGPIGADGGIPAGRLKFLGGTGVMAGFGTDPAGGKVFQPSTDWQTVSLLRGADPLNPVDPTYAWSASDGTDHLNYNFGILESIAFAMDDTNSGPYNIYIDNLMNEDVLVQDFEAANPGANTVLFNQPSFSGSTSPALLAQPPGTVGPNISKVNNETADTGANCLQVNWQFKDAALPDWLRLTTQGSGTPNPEVDLRLPISFRMLLLPVGQGIPQTAPIIATQPQGQTVLQSGTATLSVGAHGSPQPLTYQWRFNGGIIAGATSRSLTLANVQLSAAGKYSVDVGKAIGTNQSSTAVVSVVTSRFSSVMTPLWSLAEGSRVYLTNDGSQGGIGYSPASGHLLLVSGAGGSNAIYVLDASTGAFLNTLNTDPSVITDGALALNLIGVADDGYIYAANLSTNLTAPNLKIYGWPDDVGDLAPVLVWAGDPGAGGGGGTDRWGDSLAVRGSGSDFRIILLGSYSGTLVSQIQPAFGPSSAPSGFNVTGASPGDFGLGFAFGAGDTLYSKNINGPLRHVQLDFNAITGMVLTSLAVYPNMGPIGVDPVNKLLAGISTETPDNLRLLDLSPPAGPPFNLDTEFFPTDNPNPNHTGSVTFGGGRVYALDSNNGLIALTLNLACVPINLSLARSGSDIVLSWGRGDYRLQGATTLGNWGDISTSSPATNSVSSGITYYRLICP